MGRQGKLVRHEHTKQASVEVISVKIDAFIK